MFNIRALYTVASHDIISRYIIISSIAQNVIAQCIKKY